MIRSLIAILIVTAVCYSILPTLDRQLEMIEQHQEQLELSY